jgi:thermostable 8-oxoguanine DNA glycosylase
MMVVVVSTNISSKLGIHFWHTTTGNCQSILNKQKFRYMKKKPTVILSISTSNKYRINFGHTITGNSQSICNK